MSTAAALVIVAMWVATSFAMWLAAKHNEDSQLATWFVLVLVMLPAAVTTAQFAK